MVKLETLGILQTNTIKLLFLIEYLWSSIMNTELQKLEQILKNYPMNNKASCENTLTHIKDEEASLIWKYAQQYVSIAKEVDIVK